VKSKLSFTTIFAWLGSLLGVPTVKIFEKRCSACGNEFQPFRKLGVSIISESRQLCTMAKIFNIGGLISFLGLAIPGN